MLTVSTPLPTTACIRAQLNEQVDTLGAFRAYCRISESVNMPENFHHEPIFKGTHGELEAFMRELLPLMTPEEKSEALTKLDPDTFDFAGVFEEYAPRYKDDITESDRFSKGRAFTFRHGRGTNMQKEDFEDSSSRR
jgi:hypothetical protein